MLVPHSLCGLGIVRGIYLPSIFIPICCIFPFLVVMVHLIHMQSIQRVSNAWYLFEHPCYWIYGGVIAFLSCRGLVICLWHCSSSLDSMPIGWRCLVFTTFFFYGSSLPLWGLVRILSFVLPIHEWWAFTPANVSVCWFYLHSSTYLFALIILLSEW